MLIRFQIHKACWDYKTSPASITLKNVCIDFFPCYTHVLNHISHSISRPVSLQIQIEFRLISRARKKIIFFTFFLFFLSWISRSLRITLSLKIAEEFPPEWHFPEYLWNFRFIPSSAKVHHCNCTGLDYIGFFKLSIVWWFEGKNSVIHKQRRRLKNTLKSLLSKNLFS